MELKGYGGKERITSTGKRAGRVRDLVQLEGKGLDMEAKGT